MAPVRIRHDRPPTPQRFPPVTTRESNVLISRQRPSVADQAHERRPFERPCRRDSWVNNCASEQSASSTPAHQNSVREHAGTKSIPCAVAGHTCQPTGPTSTAARQPPIRCGVSLRPRWARAALHGNPPSLSRRPETQAGRP
jgi:hypothetical protein